MAKAILQDLADARGIAMTVTSAGTAGWHIGRPADPRTTAELSRHNITLVHRARQFTTADFARTDLVLAMDADNYADLISLATNPSDLAKIHLIRDFDPHSSAGSDVPDPYYADQGRFGEIFALLTAASEGLLMRIARDGTHAWHTT
jgi:protein-tyrosine phosphatase